MGRVRLRVRLGGRARVRVGVMRLRSGLGSSRGAAPRKEKSTGRRGVCPVRKGEDEMKRRDLKMGRSTSLPGR